MKPPETINVIDTHGGFTAQTRERRYVRVPEDYSKPFERWESRWVEGSTVWRPGKLLRKGTTGKLLDYDEKSFYQLNDDVTKARYKVPGYGYKVVLWFDNRTGERIA